MSAIELSITFLKEQLANVGSEWKSSMDKEKMMDCLALIDAINELEERAYNKIQM